MPASKGRGLMKNHLLVFLALFAMVTPAAAERPNPRDFAAKPSYKDGARSPVFQKIPAGSLLDAVKVISGRSHAAFGYNTPEVQIHMPRIDNSAYAEVRWDVRGRPRLTDAKGKAVNYELERGIYQHDSFSDEIRFKSKGEKPAVFARAAGRVLLKYPVVIRTIVVKPGKSTKEGIGVKFEGPYVTCPASYASLPMSGDLGVPFEPLRAYDGSGRQLRRAPYQETTSGNDVMTKTFAYYGNVARLEIDVIEKWSEMEIAYDLPPAPLMPEGREGLSPPKQKTVAETPGGKVVKAFVKEAPPSGQPAAGLSTPPAEITPPQARAKQKRQGAQVNDGALWLALMAQDSKRAHKLLEAGANPNIRRSHINDTPLLFATTMDYSREPAKQKEVVKIVLDLIAYGADVNASMAETNATPILNAASYMPPDVVRSLIKAGAKMKTTAKGGATPLMMAVLMGRTENVRALIEAGYDVAPERKALLPLAAGNADIQKLLQNPPAHKNK